MAENIFEINDDNFESEVLNSDKPVLVDFWAPWCGPCRALAPTIEDLASSYHEKIKFTKVNTDNNPITPSKYDVRSIPTLYLFQGGEVKEKIIGNVAKSKLEEAIKKLL